MSESVLRVAVAGAGYWGPNLIRNIAGADRAKLRAVCDAAAERRKYVEKAYPGVATCEHLDELLSDSSLDALIIALPAGLHYDATRAALLAGKHVLVEKPLALRGSEAMELVQLAAEKKCVLMVGHTFEYNPAVRRIKEFLDEGALGEVYYLYSQRLNLGRVRQDVDVVWNLAPHDVSIIMALLGELPLAVAARGITRVQDGIADVAFLDLEFPGGVAAHVQVSWLDPSKVRRMTVVGSKKMVVYDDVSPDAKIWVYDKGIDRAQPDGFPGYDTFDKFQLIQRAGDIVIPKLKFTEPLALECADFVRACLEGSRPTADGVSGLKVVKVLETASRSMAERGAMLEIDWSDVQGIL
jgi:predicted dehydrogenase